MRAEGAEHQRTREAIQEAAEQAAFANEMTTIWAEEQRRQTTANAWSLQAQARIQQAWSLYHAGMYKEALGQVLTAIDEKQGDPGNIGGVRLAAKCFQALGNSAEARHCFENEIRLLSTANYWTDATLCYEVLRGLPENERLLKLFASVVKANIVAPKATFGPINSAADIVENFRNRKRLNDASSILECLLQTQPTISDLLSASRRLVYDLDQSGEATVANHLLQGLTGKAHSFLDYAYLVEISTILKKDGMPNVIRYLRGISIDSGGVIESQITQLKELSQKCEITTNTVARVMEPVRAMYVAWKPEIERRISENITREVKLLQINGRGGIIGIVSYFVLWTVAGGILSTVVETSAKFQDIFTAIGLGLIVEAVLIGTFSGGVVKRFKARKEMEDRLQKTVALQNRAFHWLGLPEIMPLTSSGPSPWPLFTVGTVLTGIYTLFLLSICLGKISP
jgi:tetratricopeptide (TPR) repeat protein